MAKDWQQLGLRPHLTKKERLPRSYKEVEKVLKDVKACKGNLKTVLNNSKLRGAVFKKVYALAANVLKYRRVLDRIIQETELLKTETFLREELAGILIYELIFGKGLPGESRPVIVVKQYEDSIRKAYEIAMKDGSMSVEGLQSLPRYVRVNTLLTTVTDVLKSLRKAEYKEIYYGENISEKEYLDLVRNLETGNFLIDYHFKDLLVFASSENLTSWSLFQKNHVYIQDKSSYIPVYALDPKPGSVVIDACAAPGMKTIHIAAALENKGKIYAYEKNENRFQILKDMLDHATVEICEAECADFYLVNANDPKFLDLECILVDPSCSGSGMVNRMDTVTDTEDSKNRGRLQKLAGFQILLLKHALSFPSVKRVVYSTCSISEEENEYVVHEVLNHFCHMFKLVSVMPNWQIRGSENYEFGKLCLRAHPEQSLTNGFFVAMFERLDYDEQLNAPRPFSDKSSKKKRKRNENYDKRDGGGWNTINDDVSEPLNSSQFIENKSSAETHHTFKKVKKERTVEKDFNQDAAENNDYINLESNKIKGKHSVGINNKYETSESKVLKKRSKKETSKSVDIDNCSERPNETISINNNNVDLSNSDLIKDSTYPDKSSFDNHSKKKKKKHKKELSRFEDDEENDVGNNIKTNCPQNEIDEEKPEFKLKRHKHKKKHSKEKAQVYDSLQESEMTIETSSTSGKKHKKKHSKRDSETSEVSQDLITCDKNSFCDDTEVSSPFLVQQTKQKHELYEEKPSKVGQEIEETSLKKKHKKKCKDKRSKEE